MTIHQNIISSTNWKHTVYCFKIAESPQNYWFFDLVLSGCWNIFLSSEWESKFITSSSKLWGFGLGAIRWDGWVGPRQIFLSSKWWGFGLGVIRWVRRLGGTSADSASWRGRGEEEAAAAKKSTLSPNVFGGCQKCFELSDKETTWNELIIIWTF